MRQSKNSKFKFLDKKISLEDFILWCINVATDLAVYHVDNKLIERIEFEIRKKYNLYGKDSNFAVARLFNPIFWYLTEGEYVFDKKAYRRKAIRKALMPHDGYGKWNPRKELKKLSLEKKKEISKRIVEEHHEYYEANIEKYGLGDKIICDI